MIEIIVGILCLAAGIGLLSGIAAASLGLGPLGFVVGKLIAFAGSVLVAHGVFRRLRDGRSEGQYGFRSGGLAFATLAGLTVVLFFGAVLLAPVTVSGVAVGYHAVAEAVPLELLLLFMVFNRKQSVLDREAALETVDQPPPGPVYGN